MQWLSSPRVLRQIPDWAQSLLGVNKARENKEIDEIMRHARVPAAPAPRLMQVQAPLSLAAGPNPACLAFASLRFLHFALLWMHRRRSSGGCFALPQEPDDDGAL